MSSPSTALITGAAKRLGQATAIALATKGYDCILHYHTSCSAAEQTAAQVESHGVKSHLISADLSLPDAAEAMFAQAREQLGPISVLINNASVYPGDTLATAQPATMQHTLAVNSISPYTLGRSFAKQDLEGTIINLLDARVMDGCKNHLSYHLSKVVLRELTEQMARDFAPRIRVNAVAPGLILTTEDQTDEYLTQLSESNYLQTHGTADDIVTSILFLISSRFITGQTIFVDGGRHLRKGIL